jgi:UDP-2,3-diacylglucosamine hydrolase
MSVRDYTPTLSAPPHWCQIDFISDLHLQASQRATFKAWQLYMAETSADALFILGDLFEVWVGDDITYSSDLDGVFARQCQAILHNTAQRLPVYFIHGNRDFLLGDTFARVCDMTLLPDPTALDFDGQRWLLSHGDALCLADTDYQQFRQQVRSDAWQDNFLTQNLSQRLSFARSLRAQSESRKAGGVSYFDLDTTEVCAWLNAASAGTLIHGHTHHLANHVLDASTQPPLRRLVLSDWDAAAQPPRLQVLRLQVGQDPQRLDLDPVKA